MGRRLFVSVDLAPPLHAPVSAAQQPFEDLSGVRTVDPTGVHITLKFFGDVPEDRISTVTTVIETAVDAAGVEPFPAAFGGFGVFPSFSYISVIWIGVREGATAMTELHEALEREAVAAGFEAESHEFTPHVTIARMDHAAAKEEVQEIVASNDPDIGEMSVDAISLKESVLTDDGPVYETVEHVPL